MSYQYGHSQLKALIVAYKSADFGKVKLIVDKSPGILNESYSKSLLENSKGSEFFPDFSPRNKSLVHMLMLIGHLSLKHLRIVQYFIEQGMPLIPKQEIFEDFLSPEGKA